MFGLIFLALLGVVILVIATDQFVTGASRVARDLNASQVLVGAVILGCGIGLPELVLAFHGQRHSPFRELVGLEGGGSHTIGIMLFGLVLVLLLMFPIIFPDRMKRHSPLILLATILFAALLRGSLDRVEGVVMLLGFVIGVAWVLHSDAKGQDDPFAPIIDDDYETHGAYIEAPVMTPVQLEMTRSVCGLFGTILGAQLLAQSAGALLRDNGFSAEAQGLVLVALGSLLPHVVVAVQALRQHHEGLAVGNLIGSNLFHSLAIGGLVAIIKPYEPGGALTISMLGILLATALITYLLLHYEEDVSRLHGFALLGAYLVLAGIAVP